MLHSKRIWSIVPADSAEWLAEQLTQCTWCGCNGIRLGIYVFVNDATCADGAQEYGVLRAEGDHYVQIESLTFLLGKVSPITHPSGGFTHRLKFPEKNNL